MEWWNGGMVEWWNINGVFFPSNICFAFVVLLSYYSHNLNLLCDIANVPIPMVISLGCVP